ncbi:MAG: general stress protein CsbD [Bacteroidia bacterium]|nr:general stress protein CsbD [Bacteroidia bacterium]
MNLLNIKENCKEIKAKFVQQYSNLTEEDLRCDDGKRKEYMLEKLQQKLGKSPEELHDLILKL